jgi:hypothetical protein
LLICAVQAGANLTVVFLDPYTQPNSVQDSASCCETSISSSWGSVLSDTGVQQLQNWPLVLLPQQFPGAHIIQLPYLCTPDEVRSSKQRGTKAAAALVQAVQSAWHEQWAQQQQQQQQQHSEQQLVLVGHGFGGHLIKVWQAAPQHCHVDKAQAASACKHTQSCLAD